MCAELEGSGKVSDMPAGAVPPGSASGDDADANRRAPVWQSSPPGSLYDYIRVASFSLDREGRIDQWSRRAAEFFGVTAEEALGQDPVTAFAPPDVQERGHERLRDILDGREWTGLVPYHDAAGTGGLAEVYVMPADHGALCIAVDVATLKQIETDLAASQAVFGQSPMGFVLFDTKLRLIRVNDRFATVFGRPADQHRGRGPHDFLSRVEADRLSAALRQVLETGEPVLDMPLVGTVPGDPARRRWSMSLYRLHSGTGRPIGVAGLAMDVTGRQRAEREAAHARRNLQLLNEAGSRIGTSLDLETTARELLDVAVPHFCDLASVDLYQALLSGEEDLTATTDGSGQVRRVAFASAVSDAPVAMAGDDDVSPGDGPVKVGAVHRYRFSSASARALRTAQPQVLDSDSLDTDLGGTLVQSTLVVPMVARDTVLGLVQFSRAKGSEPFAERDRMLAEELAGRAAIFIDNARLYRREHERALILQRSLLPPDDPEAAGLDIACRYLPGSMETEVGGDWFDVIELPGHRTALVVGDVMGRGLRAAVAMGELRTAVRTLAMLDLEPAEVLGALDEVVGGLGAPGRTRRAAKDTGDDLFEVYLATCVYAVYDAVTRRCTIANAGHLPPVVVEPGETPLLLELPRGVPLGVGGEPFEEIEVQLTDGALLALYTDGLVESRSHPLDEGLDAFRASLAGPARPLEDVCDHVLATLDTAHGEDDIALLMARIRGLSDEHVGDWTLEPQPTSVARARELARGQLLAWGLDGLVDTTELLVSELVTNALRHGYGDIRLRLLLDRTLVCEVWDSALLQPRRRRARDTDEGGRGLQLVAMLSQSWGSRRTHRGKTVWFELALRGGPSAKGGPSVDDLLSMF